MGTGIPQPFCCPPESTICRAMSEAAEKTEYVEDVPIPLDQPTIAFLAWLERATGEPAREIASRFLRDMRDQFSAERGGQLH